MGLAEANVQADWNQNDETAADYVKNRPFYIANVQETILAEDPEMFDSNTYTVNKGLVEGALYCVVIDGVSYECVARNDGSGTLYIGNQVVAGDWEFLETIESNEPFFIYYNSEQDPYALCVGVYDGQTHSITVLEKEETIVKLDKKYLPDDLTLDWDKIENRPFYYKDAELDTVFEASIADFTYQYTEDEYGYYPPNVYSLQAEYTNEFSSYDKVSTNGYYQLFVGDQLINDQVWGRNQYGYVDIQSYPERASDGSYLRLDYSTSNGLKVVYHSTQELNQNTQIKLVKN